MEPKRQTSSTVSGDNMDSVAELWPSTRGSPAVSEGEGEAGGALLFSRCGSVWFSSSHSSFTLRSPKRLLRAAVGHDQNGSLVNYYVTPRGVNLPIEPRAARPPGSPASKHKQAIVQAMVQVCYA